MSLFISSLNSGSNGNCYYVGNSNEAILVDAGLSCKETEKRMAACGLDIKKVRAIFISHEHSDHIKGLAVLATKYNLPVYITPATAKHVWPFAQNDKTRNLNANDTYKIGDLFIKAFPKIHDAADPHSFIIMCKDVTVGVFTDIGKACDNLTSHFNKCDAAFLEANYDEDMLESGRYPIFLKNRIRGGEGHLSNKQALEVFVKHRSSFMKHLFLSHLSKDNNCPNKALNLFEEVAENVNIVVASRYCSTEVYHITREKPLPLPRKALQQMSLFDQISF